MRKIFTVAICLIACLCLNGCSALNLAPPAVTAVPTTGAPDSTEVAETTAAETSPAAAAVSNVQQGFFVQSKDGTLTSLLERTPSMNSSIPDTMIYTGLFMWFRDDVVETIPTVEAGVTELVYLQDAEIVYAPVVLERFEEKGYTFGITFGQAAGSTVISIPDASIYPGTTAAEQFAGQTDLDAYFFEKIDGVAIAADSIKPYKQSYYDALRMATTVPEGDDTVMTNEEGMIGVFEFLEKDKEYTLSGYKGTVPVEIKLKAELRCFTPVDPITHLDPLTAYTRSDSLDKTTAVVNLPADLPGGYYVLNGDFVFYYKSSVVAPTTETEAPAA